MLNPNYYRRQAEICTRLASAAIDQERARHFKVLALEMLLRAADAPNDVSYDERAGTKERAGNSNRSD
jgi:hypothetical protein